MKPKTASHIRIKLSVHSAEYLFSIHRLRDRNLGYTLDEIEEMLFDPDSYGLELARAEL